MRLLALSAVVSAFLLAPAARADDVRPPAISGVKASAKGGQVHVEARITDETGVLSAVVHHRTAGGKVEDTPMIKDEYDDVFKAGFAGGPDTEYWIESSDLLGNGPSSYGSAGKAFTAGGKPGNGEAVASKEPAPKGPPQRRVHHARGARTQEAPVIDYQKPSAQPPQGQDYAVRMKIRSRSPVAVAILQSRQQGGSTFTNTPLRHTAGDEYEAVIPGGQARGTLEYFIAAKNQAGLMTRQGDGDQKTPYLVTFKPGAMAASGNGAAGPFLFTHLPLYRVAPGKPILVRAQVVPVKEDGDLPDRVAVLWRGNDAQDQFAEMVPDQTGGYGGYKAQLPAQQQGAIFYQIVACDPGAAHCGDDTGGKRKWHAVAVSAQPGAAHPLPIDAVSSKAPPSLPE